MAEWGKQPVIANSGLKELTDKQRREAIARSFDEVVHGQSYTKTGVGVGITYKAGKQTGVSYTGQKGGKAAAKKPAAKKPAAKKPAAKKPAAKKPAAKKTAKK